MVNNNSVQPMSEVSAEQKTTEMSFMIPMKLREVERQVILKTLEEQRFNRTHTAKALGIGIRTLQRKLKLFGASELGRIQK